MNITEITEGMMDRFKDQKGGYITVPTEWGEVQAEVFLIGPKTHDLIWNDPVTGEKHEWEFQFVSDDRWKEYPEAAPYNKQKFAIWAKDTIEQHIQ